MNPNVNVKLRQTPASSALRIRMIDPPSESRIETGSRPIPMPSDR
jgi:hypothetical protein